MHGATQGVIEANAEGEAIKQLKDEGFIVVSIEQVDDTDRKQIDLFEKPIKEQDLSLICDQFSTILDAGLPIVRTLALVANQVDNKKLKEILLDVADDVAAGYGLADSFKKRGPELPTTFIETVRSGERSGNLAESFEKLHDYYKRTSKAKADVKTALIYPIMVLSLAVVVIAIIMVFAMPVFIGAFKDMSDKLPAATRFLIDLSEFMSNYGLVILVVVLVLAMAIFVAKKTNKEFALAMSKRKLQGKVMGRIRAMNTAAQFASTMSVMLGAGLSVVESVQTAIKVCPNEYVAHTLELQIPNLESGRTISRCLSDADVFPSLMTEMAAIGEQTGSLTDTMDTVASFYEEETSRSIERALSLLEPLTIILLAVIVTVILLAVYLPMFSIYDAIG